MYVWTRLFSHINHFISLIPIFKVACRVSSRTCFQPCIHASVGFFGTLLHVDDGINKWNPILNKSNVYCTCFDLFEYKVYRFECTCSQDNVLHLVCTNNWFPKHNCSKLQLMPRNCPFETLDWLFSCKDEEFHCSCAYDSWICYLAPNTILTLPKFFNN